MEKSEHNNEKGEEAKSVAPISAEAIEERIRKAVATGRTPSLDEQTELLEVIAGLRLRFSEQEQLVRQREREVEERTRALLDALYDAKKYLLILEQADRVVILLDGASRRFVYINKSAEEVFGFLRDDILRKETPDILKLIPLEGKAKLFESKFQELLGKDEVFRASYAFTTINGTQGAVRMTVSRFTEEGGGFLYVMIGEDITRERELERDERKRVEETDRLNQLMIGRELRMIELKKELRRLSVLVEASQLK